MAGHSKWANIKHRKDRQDAKRGKIFTKYIREITVASRMGGPSEADNPRLRAIVAKALTSNLSRDIINRAIQRGAGGGESETVHENTYEGYGVNGVAVLVETMTDNVNRTVSDVRHAFSKCGGNLGTSGSVAYMFTQRGEITFENGDEDKIMEVALEAGADDVITENGNVIVITNAHNFGAVEDALTAAGLKANQAEVTMHAATQADITDVEAAQKIMKLIDMLEDLDDVQNVYSNANFSDEVMEKLES
ncbi:MAG: YebC/PmpR family DNA-binding transcriptional regulator [Fluviicoccus sp.]|uniref:YebC/PmpR family DNA-binding transcriptional regulator n=1 Tax=Fluviicoccus sp. TaxID=2003552 RepID=UPI002716D51B|nr:YebC/PmpR family DNA-binding transcriptional regulator [Fluviicoccus sp.]MDO8329387.1 YebC/PmpR family DNA-binding transcriptional regulator [Fluviicoccus sp.]